MLVAAHFLYIFLSMRHIPFGIVSVRISDTALCNGTRYLHHLGTEDAGKQEELVPSRLSLLAVVGNR